MTRFHLWAVVAGVAVAAPSLPARADEPSAPAPAVPKAEQKTEQKADRKSPAPAPQAEDKPGDAAPADPRDQKIRELEEKLNDALKRIEQLEKNQGTPPPATPPVPETPGTPAPATPGAPAAPETPAPETQPAPGSATLIPNISAIGNIIFGAGDTRRVPNRGRFNFDEFEIALQDAVAPKLRYDVFLSASKGEDWKLGMEEGYLTATAVEPNLNIRLGEIRTPFGKFNPQHPHSWPFITQPSAVTAFLGPEGLVGDGGVAEYTLPLKNIFARLDVGAWQTASETERGLGFGGGDLGAYSGRLWTGTSLGRDRELEFGISRYQGRGDVRGFGRRDKAVNGIDLTYRSYPKAFHRLLLSAELMDHQTNLPGRTADALGGFAYLAYRWSQFYEGGGRIDYTRFPYPIDSYDWGGSLFLTRYITEQTSLRLEYQYTRSPLLGTGSGIYFQILFGSGPHTHNLQ